MINWGLILWLRSKTERHGDTESISQMAVARPITFHQSRVSRPIYQVVCMNISAAEESEKGVLVHDTMRRREAQCCQAASAPCPRLESRGWFVAAKTTKPADRMESDALHAVYKVDVIGMKAKRDMW
jgi:hypothetical protein